MPLFQSLQVLVLLFRCKIDVFNLSSFWYAWFGLFGFFTSSSTTRLYRGRAPRQSVWQFYVLPHMRQSWETMTSVSAGHIILTATQPVGSGRPQRGSNPGPPHQESRALPTDPPRPPFWYAPEWLFVCIFGSMLYSGSPGTKKNHLII